MRSALARSVLTSSIAAVTTAVLASASAAAVNRPFVLTANGTLKARHTASVLLSPLTSPFTPLIDGLPARGGAVPAVPPTPALLAAKAAAQRSLTGRGKHMVLVAHAGARAAHGAAGPKLTLGPVLPGLDENGSGGFDPPDPQVAVSPTYAVEMVNVAGLAFSRSGPTKPVSLPAIFGSSGAPDNFSDPQVSYDALSGHFIAGMMDTKQNNIDIAVSDSADPTAGWTSVSTSFGNNYCPDQPKMGYDDQVIAFSVNLFQGGNCDSNRGSSIGTFLMVINKADILNPAVNNPHYQTFSGANFSKIAPARSLSSTSTEYLAAASSDNSKYLYAFAYNGAPPFGAFQNTLKVPINALNDPPTARQQGTSTRLDTDDNRVRDAVYRNGILFAAANDGCEFQGDSSEHACARVLELSLADQKMLIDDDLGFVGEDAYYPALEPDVNNNLDVVFGFSSPHEYPGFGFIGYTRTGYTDVQTIASGNAPLTGTDLSPGVQRLGDYFGAEVDPAGPNVVWATGEYGKSSGVWGTAVGAMTLVPGAISQPPPPPPSPAVRSARYHGSTGQHRSIAFRTSADGQHLIEIDYTLRYRCGDRSSHSINEYALSRQDTVPLAKNGSFSFAIDEGSGSFQFSGTTSVAGRFSGSTANGTIRSNVRSRHRGTCTTGKLSWSVHT